ncbi:hypothetical protein BJX68DRAFT_232675 [Aspergillus pseudodeflectus]|uniref:Secreted protein n=1 Tax=Aspergillus pseudodeflectus TaxID=176178 RepID=A0ABR4KP10_9EURO
MSFCLFAVVPLSAWSFLFCLYISAPARWQEITKFSGQLRHGCGEVEDDLLRSSSHELNSPASLSGGGSRPSENAAANPRQHHLQIVQRRLTPSLHRPHQMCLQVGDPRKPLAGQTSLSPA